MHELTIERELALPPDRAFDAFTEPTLLAKWFAPNPKMSCEATCELRVGGSYRIAMHDPDTHEDHIVVGEYLVIEPGARLSFSWRWHTSEVVTVVDVRFGAGSGEATTLIHLHHTEFPDQPMCDRHSMGWTACLGNLDHTGPSL